MSLSVRKKRREVNLYSYYDHAGIVRHLEELARQGWQLEHTGSVFWTYRRCEPAELHYAVVYFPKASQFDPEPPPEQRDFWALCKATGWELVSNRYQMQVFCNPAKNPTPIETDPVVQVENVHAAMKAGAARSNWLMLCCALLQIWAQFRNAETIRDLLSSGISLLAVLLWGLILMDSVAELIAYYRWSKRAAVAAREEGVLLSPRSHKWRRVLELSLIAVFCAAYLGTLLAANRYGMAVYTGLLLWFLYAALLSLVIHGSRYLMKKHGFPAEHNLLLKARLGNIMPVAAGEGIGYGFTYHTSRDSIIGLLPLGFSDGFTRAFSNRFFVTIRGYRCPVVGNICMDHCMIDLTDLPNPQIGEEIVVYGDGLNGPDGAMNIQEVADLRGTIVDEVMTNLAARLPRRYV